MILLTLARGTALPGKFNRFRFYIVFGLNCLRLGLCSPSPKLSVVKDGLELLIFLDPPPEGGSYRHGPPHPV